MKKWLLAAVAAVALVGAADAKTLKWGAAREINSLRDASYSSVALVTGHTRISRRRGSMSDFSSRVSRSESIGVPSVIVTISVSEEADAFDRPPSPFRRSQSRPQPGRASCRPQGAPVFP